jgi:hypothetical protein
MHAANDVADDILAFPELYGPRGKEVVRFIQGLSYVPWLTPPSVVTDEIARGMTAQHCMDHGLKIKGVSLIEDHPSWINERELIKVTVQQTAVMTATETALSLAGDLIWARDPADQQQRIADVIKVAQEEWRPETVMKIAEACRSKERTGVHRAVWDATYVVAQSVAGYASHLIAGLDTGPWTALLRLWEAGCCPLGISDGYYVVLVPKVGVPRRRPASGTPIPDTIPTTVTEVATLIVDDEPTQPRSILMKLERKDHEREHDYDSIETAIDDLTRTLDAL